MKDQHTHRRRSLRDTLFLVGGNPDGSGGGIIESSCSRTTLLVTMEECIKAGYTGLRIVDWKELNG